mgnify:FL=1
MLAYLRRYCDHFSLKIKGTKIYSGENIIGDIFLNENFVQIKSKKYKYGDFALLLIENCDVTGE